jgi:hypothetical protein
MAAAWLDGDDEDEHPAAARQTAIKARPAAGKRSRRRSGITPPGIIGFPMILYTSRIVSISRTARVAPKGGPDEAGSR